MPAPCSRYLLQAVYQAWKNNALLQPLQPQEELRLIRSMQHRILLHKTEQCVTPSLGAALGEAQQLGAADQDTVPVIEELACLPPVAAHVFSLPPASAPEAANHERYPSLILSQALHDGFTLVLRDLDWRWAASASLSSQLEAAVGLPVGANLYLTPPGA